MKPADSFAVHTLNTLLSKIDGAISIINTEGDIIYWNEAAEKTYNIKKSKIIGKNIRKFFHQDDIINLQVLYTRQPVENMYHIPRPDMHVLIHSAPIYNEKNELIGSFSIEKDITTTIKLNEKLSSTTKELQQLKQQINHSKLENPFDKIKGNNQVIQQNIYDAKKVSKTDATVLLNGESGVGKELFAQAIHEDSLRKDKPFIAINCGAIPHALFESELFGYEDGAYTGAAKGGKPGKMELANGGTLFLDEVGELPLDMQVKLLRALQEKEIYRIGGRTPKMLDVRIIAATNRTLNQMVLEGRFRSDLFYRLNVITIQIPPLRERLDDIPYLVNIFLKELSFKYRKPIPKLQNETYRRFSQYDWPGNVRELHNVIERLVVLNEQEEIEDGEISKLLPQFQEVHQEFITAPLTLSLEKERLERESILQALKRTYGNKSITAKELGMSRATLYKKIKKYGIDIT